MTITDPHVLPEDLQITPVAELDPSVLALIEHQPGDFAINRPRSRTPPKIVDGKMGQLLKSFSTARPIVDAVLDFSDVNGLDPQQTLADAFPALMRFIRSGMLVELGSKRGRRILPQFDHGHRIGQWEIVHCLQALEDVEVYQIKNGERQIAALKIARDDDGRTRRMLERERGVLAALEGTIAPRLLETGLEQDRTFIVMEWRPGTKAGAVADELRSSAIEADRRRLVRLCADIAGAYAELHRRGYFHGDVHERNILIDASGSVTIVDFGYAGAFNADTADLPPRAGAGIFYEPEFATADRSGAPHPAVTAFGEQYSVSALLYSLFSGAAHINFSGDRAEMIRQIAEEPTQAFAVRGAAPHPRLEQVFGRALLKEPGQRWGSTTEFANAVREIAVLQEDKTVGPTSMRDETTRDLVESVLRQFAPGGSAFEEGIPEAPTTNVTFGSAGVACCLYRIALMREDASLLSLADIWATRAQKEIGSPRAFYNSRMGLTRRTIGPTSLYHTQSGVHVVRALIARAMSDLVTMRHATAAFIATSGRRGPEIDLTLGRAGILLGCALLLEADPKSPLVDTAALSQFGDRVARDIWTRVGGLPRIGDTSLFESLGIAHGWAGLLYATLRWRLARRQPLDTGFRSRFDQLAELAEPDGRGAHWRWYDNGRKDAANHGYMGGWCNGSAGFVHLWQAAASAFGAAEFADLALAAGWNAWEDSPEDSDDLCCGLPGRAYALLSLYRMTGDEAWYRRALTLADRAMTVARDVGPDWVSTCFNLYKSGLGAVLLVAELDRPELARMPLFEPEGWPVVP
jgi:serine/threonine-protein kinase